jgi:hypothetical protein
MPTVEEFWRPIINDFNPVGQARPEDVKRFFVDRSEKDPTRSLVQRLELSFLNSIGQPTLHKALLTGHTGSGKSSELIQLAEELSDRFFVIRFDAEFTLSPETTNHFDILLGMGLAVFATAHAAKLKPPKQLADNLLKSLSKFIRRYEDRKGFTLKMDQLLKQVFAWVFVAGAGAVGGPVAAGAAAAATTGLFTATKIELNIRDELVRTLELPTNRQEVVGALNQIIAWVQNKAKKPVLIVIDGLDKVPASRARLLFADSSLLKEPACALIYAAPIEFYHRAIAWQATNLFDEYRMLPNPIVQKRPPSGINWKINRDPDEEGIEVMRKVARKRFEEQKQSIDKIITPNALNLLAQMSGGIMREFIRYFREAATFSQLLDKMQIDDTIARKVIDQHRQEIAARLTINHRQVLQRVLEQGALSGGEYEAVEDELLHSLYLLSYQGIDTFWFDAYPNVLALLGA